MTDLPFAGGALKLRRRLQAQEPGVLDWVEGVWSSWLAAVRAADRAPAKPRVTLLVGLTCVEDLQVHVGMAQFLAAAGADCRLILCLATDESISIVRSQARRACWEALVEFTLDRDRGSFVVDKLTPDMMVVDLPRPTCFDAAEVQAFVAPRGDNGRATLAAPSWAYVGTAGEFTVGRMPSAAEVIDQFFLGVVRGADQRLNDPASGKHEALAEYPIDTPLWSGRVLPRDGTIELPLSEDWREIRIVVDDPSGASIARSFAKPGQPTHISVRLPARLITERPQAARILRPAEPEGAASLKTSLHVAPADLKPWMLGAYLNRGGAGNAVMQAFARGVGCRIAYAEDEAEVLSDIPVVWGVLRGSDRILTQAKAQGLYFFYTDHAYFNRGHGRTYRITRNAYEAGPVRICPRDRLDALNLEVQPWRKNGREILVCPPTEYFKRAHDCHDWLETTLATLAEYSDRPVVVRDKPKPGEHVTPLTTALETAHALVTHSSNVAIEAACFGTPVFVAPTSAAAPVGRTDLTQIETPYYAKRDQWLAHLAYNQFSYEEFADGTAWRLLLELEERDFA